MKGNIPKCFHSITLYQSNSFKYLFFSPLIEKLLKLELKGWYKHCKGNVKHLWVRKQKILWTNYIIPLQISLKYHWHIYAFLLTPCCFMEFQCVCTLYMGWDPNYTEIKSKLFSDLSFYPLTQTQKNYLLKGLCKYLYNCS